MRCLLALLILTGCAYETSVVDDTTMMSWVEEVRPGVYEATVQRRYSSLFGEDPLVVAERNDETVERVMKKTCGSSEPQVLNRAGEFSVQVRFACGPAQPHPQS